MSIEGVLFVIIRAGGALRDARGRQGGRGSSRCDSCVAAKLHLQSVGGDQGAPARRQLDTTRRQLELATGSGRHPGLHADQRRLRHPATFHDRVLEVRDNLPGRRSLTLEHAYLLTLVEQPVGTTVTREALHHNLMFALATLPERAGTGVTKVRVITLRESHTGRELVLDRNQPIAPL